MGGLVISSLSCTVLSDEPINNAPGDDVHIHRAS